MRIAGPLTLLACAWLSGGCASGLAREGRCLEALVPAYLAAQAEVAALDAQWRAVTTGSLLHAALASPNSSLAVHDFAQRHEAVRMELLQARQRHQPLLDAFEQVYRRIRLRMEEDRVLSQAFWSLLPTPAVLVYPVVRWNVHAVTWDGVDPDAESDPIRRLCDGVETGPEQLGVAVEDRGERRGDGRR